MEVQYEKNIFRYDTREYVHRYFCKRCGFVILIQTKTVFLIAENGKEFLNKAQGWKHNMITCNDIEFFESFEVAQEKYEFLDRGKLEQELQKIKIAK